MFGLCSAMRWSTLPNAGGLYDQHPKLLDEWMVLFNIKAEAEEQERERHKRESESKSRSTRR